MNSAATHRGAASLAFFLAVLAPFGASIAAESTTEIGSQQGEKPRPEDSTDEGFGDEIVVTAGRTEQRLRDVPVHVAILGREDLDHSAAASLDDVLRTLPSFNTQRPGSSRQIELGNQGVTFRGMGGSTASRALVLVDGVPLNEPFAGWVTWSRVPLAIVERVEVVPGGAAGAWGSQSLGGVIHVLTRRPSAASFDAQLRVGSRETYEASLFGSDVRGPWAAAAYANHYDTEGHIRTPDRWRGPADTPVGIRSSVADLRLERSTGASTRWTLQSSWLSEARQMGTILSTDDLDMLSLRAAGERTLRYGALVGAQLFGLDRDGPNHRGTPNASRTEVTPRSEQFDVPARSLGAMVHWTRPFLARGHLVSAGVDAQWTDTEVHEHLGWTGTRWGQLYDAAGQQLLSGVYLQDSIALGERWRLAAGGRVDLWRTSNGTFRGTNLVTGASLHDRRLPDRSEVVFSPNLGARLEASDHLALRGAIYQSFRAPSPNEMLKSSPTMRNFLAANNDLDPERVNLGLEAGFDWRPTNRTLFRATGFWNEVEDAILDVTVGFAGAQPRVIEPCGRVAAGGECQQRQNIERMRTHGLESEFELRSARAWRLWVSHTYTEAEILESKVDQSIIGNTTRRIPEHQGTAQLSYQARRPLSAALLVRYQGERWEDNSNLFMIGDAWIADLRFNRAVGRELEFVLTVENLFDVPVEVSRNALYGELSAPRTIHAGLRWRSRDRAGTSP